MIGSNTEFWFAYAVVVMAVVGALVGSFANVVIYRVPAGMSVVRPRSSCPGCSSPIRSRDNIPLLSWLVLRGRCRDCGEPISIRYPLIELAVAILSVAVLVWQWPVISEAETPAALAAALCALLAYQVFMVVSVVLTAIDLETRRLPNRIVGAAFLSGALLLSASAILGGDYVALGGAALGAATLFSFYFLVAFAYPGGMGFGDVKLAAVVGLYLGWLGWDALAVGAFSAFLFGGVFSLVLVAVRKAGRKTSVPFGPWMIVGAWVGIVFGKDIAAAYLGLFGLV